MNYCFYIYSEEAAWDCPTVLRARRAGCTLVLGFVCCALLHSREMLLSPHREGCSTRTQRKRNQSQAA